MSYDSGYNNTSYGGYGNNDAGGFVNKGYGGNAATDNKFSSPGGGDRVVSEGKSRLRPVTLKQIIGATQAHADAEFFIDGAEVSTVTFVAIVRNVAQQTTNAAYRVEDGTGTFELRRYTASDRGADNEAPNFPQTGDYVRVIGEMKLFNDKRYVQISLVRPITDFNEVIFAQLEALAIHLQTIHRDKLGDAGNGSKNVQSTSMSGSTRNYGNENLTTLQRRIMETLESAQEQTSNEGVNIHAISQRIGASVESVQKSAEALLESGLVYTTIDYDHYKLT
ncbi:hypothetical protein V1512DRAFT_260442 [Lipomyces arxii]|uniref:uncharacterized protein n=1 Tax=Lipomyces arxii TaxID=56418 RepID=UPI0034CD1335